MQFARFATNAARGDFGKSFFHREPAFKLVMERMPLRGVIAELSDANSLAALALWLQG